MLVHQIIVVTVFLNGNLKEEIFIEQLGLAVCCYCDLC